MVIRYYSRLRPLMPGSLPHEPKPVKVYNFPEPRKINVLGGQAMWGYVEYDEPLDEKVAEAYELRRADEITWYCVVSAVYDDGRVIAHIVDAKPAVNRPDSTVKELRNKTIYADWFGSRDEAEKFLIDCK